LAKIDVPGLAMSRSVGDDVAHSVGVSSEVEVTTHKISKNDQFMILASDGVWEFISSQEAVDLVASSSNNMDQAVRKLVKKAQDEWRKYEQVIDDITAVIITFSPASSGEQDPVEPLQL
jgi:serine/threonine protein phosphatase PrpC